MAYSFHNVKEVDVSTVRHLLLLLHFVGFASLFGGFLTQLSAEVKRVVPAMVHGVATQLVTGFALVWAVAADGDTVDHAKVGVKLVVLVVIFGLLFTERQKERMQPSMFWAIGGLTLVNAAIAVLL